MACSHTDWLTNEEYSLQFSQKILHNRIPVTGSIDLTYRCNFCCVHCYIVHKNKEVGSSSRELSTDQWKSIIDDITDRGCMFLLITGGDPFLRPDFNEIYTYAKTKGLIITVFTNGYTITEQILRTLQKYPPRLVEITLYGATEETYTRITGKKNGFNKCLETIKKLQDHGINTGLKTVLMTLNVGEFYKMEKIADSFGIKFRYDPAIFPKFNGDKSPVSLRVAPEKVVQLDFQNKQRAGEWVQLHRRYKDVTLEKKLYNCGSGQTTFHITAEGRLQPCLMATDVTSDLKHHTFSQGWDLDIPAIRNKKPSMDNLCWDCEKNILCNYCPPFSAVEKGDENSYSEYLCALSKLRLQKITQYGQPYE